MPFFNFLLNFFHFFRNTTIEVGTTKKKHSKRGTPYEDITPGVYSLNFANLLSIVQILNAKSVNNEQKMSILEGHQSAFYNPILTPFFSSAKKQKVFLEDTSENLSQIGAELCQSTPIIMTFVDIKN